MAKKNSDGTYSLAIGFVYIFNIIVGTGALTMPKAFEKTGILLSSVLLIFLTFMSFVTATFMFEAMAIANAIKNFPKYEGTPGRTKRGFANPAYTESENVTNRLDAIVNEERPLIDETTQGKATQIYFK